MELGGNEVNQTKVDLNNDRGNNLTISGSCIDIIPHHARYQPTCSTIETLSLLENFVKSGTLY
jgi:hypothetical protein